MQKLIWLYSSSNVKITLQQYPKLLSLVPYAAFSDTLTLEFFPSYPMTMIIFSINTIPNNLVTLNKNEVL